MVTLLLFVTFSLGNAQTPGALGDSASDLTQNPTKLIEATQQYKTSTSELLSIQESEVSKATAKLDELRALVAQGLVARAELEDNEQSLANLRAQLEATKKQIADSDQNIARIQAERELAKNKAAMPGKSLVKLASKPYANLGSATILRSNGAGGWSMGDLPEIRSFFSNTFGHALPTSAVGQSATHNQLGYDHRNAVDVALHPDSTEGRTLINYLQAQGIPFLAFRAAIPGVATGPHIHIGSRSHCL